MVNAPAQSYSFGCSACGRCCNSPPALTLDELLRHESLFVGCLAVQRTRDGAVSLRTQGHDYPSLGACPARAADGLCTLHALGKPGMCSVVPLDPALPASAQRVVLQRRHAETVFLEARCLVDGQESAPATHTPLVEGDAIVDAHYLAAFERYRAELALEDERWSRALLEAMRPDLAGLRLPPGGFLALPLTPLLTLLARRSEADRARCVRYAERQKALIEATVARALGRRNPADRAFTAELRRFAEQYRRFAAAWAPPEGRSEESVCSRPF